MDIKITSITERSCAAPRRRGAAATFSAMAKALTGREEVSGNARGSPMTSIPKDKIREVIGSGGKVIRESPKRFAKIDIDDDGTIKVAAVDATAAQAAIDRSRHRRRAGTGRVYNGRVVRSLISAPL